MLLVASRIAEGLLCSSQFSAASRSCRPQTFCRSPPQFTAAARRMGGDQKLTSAEELHALFSDPARLQTYRYTQPVVSDCGIDNEKFHLELPYDAIKAKVEECRDTFLAAVPEHARYHDARLAPHRSAINILNE